MSVKTLLISISFILLPIFSYGQGVNFQAISLKEAFEQAAIDQKHVLVMFGTTHCGYSLLAYHSLGNSGEAGEFINKNFISVAYGHPEGLKAETMSELFKKGIEEGYKIKENNEETVFTNYFVFPNFFIFDHEGRIKYVFTGSKNIDKRLVKAAKKGMEEKTQTPFLFSTYFNNKMYPKNKDSLKMLSETMLAYHQLEIPDSLDYSRAKSAKWEDFFLPKSNEVAALQYIERSFEYGDFYFNQFLAALIYDKTGNPEKAIFHAKNALSNYPKHWNQNKRLLSDELLKNYLVSMGIDFGPENPSVQ
jgi:thioredoxin-related protein